MSETPEPTERLHSEAPAEGEDQADGPAEGGPAAVQQAPSGSRAHAQEPAEGAGEETIAALRSSGMEPDEREG